MHLTPSRQITLLISAHTQDVRAYGRTQGWICVTHTHISAVHAEWCQNPPTPHPLQVSVWEKSYRSLFTDPHVDIQHQHQLLLLSQRGGRRCAGVNMSPPPLPVLLMHQSHFFFFFWCLGWTLRADVTLSSASRCQMWSFIKFVGSFLFYFVNIGLSVSCQFDWQSFTLWHIYRPRPDWAHLFLCICSYCPLTALTVPCAPALISRFLVLSSCATFCYVLLTARFAAFDHHLFFGLKIWMCCESVYTQRYIHFLIKFLAKTFGRLVSHQNDILWLFPLWVRKQYL